jgi:deoxyribodipyrimidine photo-lyase
MAAPAVFWLRRDFRLEDNAGLYYALKSGMPVRCLFIFDQGILSKLEDRNDARVHFIHQSVVGLKRQLQALGSDLEVRIGEPLAVWQALLDQWQPAAVYTNEDYEPYARKRDAALQNMLRERGITLFRAKDHVVFRPDEVLKPDGKPYTVFTPYSKTWKAKLNDFYLKPYPSEHYLYRLDAFVAQPMPSLADVGFEPSGMTFPGTQPSSAILEKYHEQRDLPAVQGTTRLSLHFRFGTVSIRSWAQKGLHTNEKWLNELIWRDFYQMILWHFPDTPHKSFKPAYDRIDWERNEELFDAWCQGKTGYPLVDAGMRELLHTGFMHNRVRMVVASFLCKHLLLDWRWGERWFARKLLDFELASNVGGWQWAAGSGNDAAPYFRVFNPALQLQKFDPHMQYVKQWVPEWGTSAYPEPIVEHTWARNRALERFQLGLAL